MAFFMYTTVPSSNDANKKQVMAIIYTNQYAKKRSFNFVPMKINSLAHCLTLVIQLAITTNSINILDLLNNNTNMLQLLLYNCK